MKIYGLLSALVSGLLFGVGLVYAGMTQPRNVIAFLDFFGAWDPRLAFVMIGAIGVYGMAFRLTQRRSKPLFSDIFHLPTRFDIDRDLILGSATFGIGWALGGFCPGPALTSLVTFEPAVVVFLVCMTLGMIVRSRLSKSC